MLYYKVDPFCCAVTSVGRKVHMWEANDPRLYKKNLEVEYQRFMTSYRRRKYQGLSRILTYWHVVGHRNMARLLEREGWTPVYKTKSTTSKNILVLYIKKM